VKPASGRRNEGGPQGREYERTKKDGSRRELARINKKLSRGNYSSGQDKVPRQAGEEREGWRMEDGGVEEEALFTLLSEPLGE